MTVHAKHDVMRLSNVDPNSHLGLRIKKRMDSFPFQTKFSFINSKFTLTNLITKKSLLDINYEKKGLSLLTISMIRSSMTSTITFDEVPALYIISNACLHLPISSWYFVMVWSFSWLAATTISCSWTLLSASTSKPSINLFYTSISLFKHSFSWVKLLPESGLTGAWFFVGRS